MHSSGCQGCVEEFAVHVAMATPQWLGEGRKLQEPAVACELNSCICLWTILPFEAPR